MSRNYIQIIWGSGLEFRWKEPGHVLIINESGSWIHKDNYTLFSTFIYSWNFHNYTNQKWLILTSTRIFHHNVRDFEQFQRKGHLPICCYGLQEAWKKGSARHLQEKTWNCPDQRRTNRTVPSHLWRTSSKTPSGRLKPGTVPTPIYAMSVPYVHTHDKVYGFSSACPHCQHRYSCTLEPLLSKTRVTGIQALACCAVFLIT